MDFTLNKILISEKNIIREKNATSYVVCLINLNEIFVEE